MNSQNLQLEILIVVAEKHFSVSRVCYLQKLGLVGIEGYHYIVLILKIFLTPPKLQYDCLNWTRFYFGSSKSLKYLQYKHIWTNLF